MTATVDYYSQCEDGLQALFRTLTDYIKHSWQVSDDDTNLKNGADYFVFFTPGMFQEIPNGDDQKNALFTWEVLFEIRVRFKSFKESKPVFKAFRSELFNIVKKHNRLDYPKPAVGRGVLKTTLSATSKMVYWADKPNQTAPSWIVQQMKANILQVVPVG